MTRNTKKLILALPAALALFAAVPRVFAERPPSDAGAWLQQGATLLDVRTPEEFAAGHAAGALNVPVQELDRRMGEVPPGKVVVYCRTGRRSAQAARILEAAGREVIDVGTLGAAENLARP